MRSTMRVEAAAYHRERFTSHPDSYRPFIRAIVEEGLSIPGYEYARARNLQREFRRRHGEGPRGSGCVLDAGRADDGSERSFLDGRPRVLRSGKLLGSSRDRDSERRGRRRTPALDSAHGGAVLGGEAFLDGFVVRGAARLSRRAAGSQRASSFGLDSLSRARTKLPRSPRHNDRGRVPRSLSSGTLPRFPCSERP